MNFVQIRSRRLRESALPLEVSEIDVQGPIPIEADLKIRRGILENVKVAAIYQK